MWLSPFATTTWCKVAECRRALVVIFRRCCAVNASKFPVELPRIMQLFNSSAKNLQNKSARHKLYALVVFDLSVYFHHSSWPVSNTTSCRQKSDGRGVNCSMEVLDNWRSHRGKQRKISRLHVFWFEQHDASSYWRL